MTKRLTSLLAVLFLLAIVLAGATRQVRAQVPAALYPVAAPLNQYLIPSQDSEVELARSAAPASLSNKAEVLVLTKDGYETAVKGGNGFVCLVERSWAKSTDDPEFWNPRMRAPICVNAPAARTHLAIVQMKTKLVLEGKSKEDIGLALKSAMDNKELQAPEPNAMCYMLSKQQYLSDRDRQWHPHLMWFVPGDSVKSWGAELPDVPVYAGYVPQDRMTVFMVLASQWSDGTPATLTVLPGR
jgi:hypothetical protein